MEADSTKTCAIYSSLMSAYFDQKKIKEGLDLLDEKAVKGCKCTYSDYFLGMYYANAVTRQYDRSVKYADEYIKIVPNGADGYYFKGLSQSQTDSIEPYKWLAKETYEKLMQIYEAKPDDARAKGYVDTAYSYMGIYYGAQQDLVKAREFFQKALAVNAANRTALNGIQQLDAAGSGGK